MSPLRFDEATAKSLDASYHKGDMIRRRRHVRQALAAAPGERILDAGCGPGFYVAELLDEVGPHGSVLGVDSSPDMLTLARRRCAGRAEAEFRAGNVSALPVDDASFDAALCVQVLEYVADATHALTELRRVLRPGGRVVVWDTDWSTAWWHTADPERMRRMLRAWDEHLAHPALPHTLAGRLRTAGFEDVRVDGHSFAAADYDPEAFGVDMLGLIAGFVSGRAGVTGADADAWAAEQHDLGLRGEFFFACTQYCFTGRKPD